MRQKKRQNNGRNVKESVQHKVQSMLHRMPRSWQHTEQRTPFPKFPPARHTRRHVKPGSLTTTAEHSTTGVQIEIIERYCVCVCVLTLFFQIYNSMVFIINYSWFSVLHPVLRKCCRFRHQLKTYKIQDCQTAAVRKIPP